MDYPSTGSGLASTTEATRLNKYQWDLIHNPQRVWFSWLEEEKEGASVLPNTALVRLILEKLRYCYVNSLRYSLTEEESGNNYCNNIKLSDGNTYSYVSVNNRHKQWSIMPNTCIVNKSNTIINYVPRDEAGIPFSVKAGDFSVIIDDPKNASFVSYMKPDAAKWQNQIAALKTEIFNEADRDKSIELMYALPDELFTTLNADYRKKYLKRLSEGTLDEGGHNRINEEQLAINLIKTTPNDQIEPIVNYLNSDRLMSDLCNGIDNIGGEDIFTSFTNALFKFYLQKYSTSLTASYILPDDKVFQWMDKGLLDKITYKVDYLSNNQIAFSWKYRQNYYTNPVKVSPFEIVAVNFTTDVNFITIPNDKRVIFMPAFIFAWMVNEDKNVDVKLKTDITIKLAEFAFAYYQVKMIKSTTSTLIKLLRHINRARTATNLILVSDAVRSEIENLTGGPSFIAAYEKINDVWEISDFTVNWFNGNIEHFTVFTQAWEKLVDSNRGIDVVTKYPEFYKLVNQIKEGLK